MIVVSTAGAGKKTIGGQLSGVPKARIIHNHVLHNVAIMRAGVDDPDRRPLHDGLRSPSYAPLAANG